VRGHVGAFREVSADGGAGDSLAAFIAIVLEAAESALPDELREHAVRQANASNGREVNFVIEIER
jgi:hypothetical protein